MPFYDLVLAVWLDCFSMNLTGGRDDIDVNPKQHLWCFWWKITIEGCKTVTLG